MDDYISREVLLSEIAADYGNWTVCNDTDESYRQGVKDNYDDTIRLINGIPGADVQPVKRGKWIIDYAEGSKIYHAHCSECGKEPTRHIGGDYYIDKLSDFCPNCGAKFIAREDDNNG